MLFKKLFTLNLESNGENYRIPDNRYHISDDNYPRVTIHPLHPVENVMPPLDVRGEQLWFYPLMLKLDKNGDVIDNLFPVGDRLYARHQGNIQTFYNLNGSVHSQRWLCRHKSVRPSPLHDVWVFSNVTNPQGVFFDEIRVMIPIEEERWHPNFVDLNPIEIAILDRHHRNLDFNGNIISETDDPILEYGIMKIKQLEWPEIDKILEFIKPIQLKKET